MPSPEGPTSDAIRNGPARSSRRARAGRPVEPAASGCSLGRSTWCASVGGERERGGWHQASSESDATGARLTGARSTAGAARARSRSAAADGSRAHQLGSARSCSLSRPPVASVATSDLICAARVALFARGDAGSTRRAPVYARSGGLHHQLQLLLLWAAPRGCSLPLFERERVSSMARERWPLRLALCVGATAPLADGHDGW